MSSIKIKLKPFSVPNFVAPIMPARPRQEGSTLSNGIPIAELDAATLAEMCEEFTQGVFEKAGKERPQ
jgi:hypothetical protein